MTLVPRYSWLVLPLFFFPLFSMAQAPGGYQGKHFFAEYDLKYLPDFFFLDLDKVNSEAHNAIGRKLRHRIKLNYVVSRRKTAFLGIDFFKTGMVHDQVFDGKTMTAEFPIRREVYYKLQVKGIEAGMSFHRRMKNHALAPIGPHFNLGFQYLQSKGTALRFWTTDHQNTESPIFPEGVNNTSSDLIFNLGMANRHIWYDRITFTYGGTFGLVLTRIHQVWSNLGRQGYYTDYTDDVYDEALAARANDLSFKRGVSSRLQRYNWLQFHIGFGVLIF